MTSIGTHELQNHLPQLLLRIAEGEEFLIMEADRPLARLGPPEGGFQGVLAHLSSEDTEDEEHPWRGIFAPERERQRLTDFSLADQELTLKRREPTPNFNFIKTDADDA